VVDDTQCGCNTDTECCHEPLCPIDCVISDWTAWSLCPSCYPSGSDGVSSSTRSRTVLRPAQNGGQPCPQPLFTSNPCPYNLCDVDCTVGPWTDWGACSILCTDGFESRTRAVTVAKVGEGMDCPPLLDTQWCFVKCPHCVYAPPTDDPCPVTCRNYGDPQQYTFTRHRYPLVIASTNVTIDTCDPQLEQVPCVLPYCPIDCIVTPWGDWSDCIDGVRTRNRTKASDPKYNGAPCPQCYLEKDTCVWTPPPGECDYGAACEEGYIGNQ